MFLSGLRWEVKLEVGVRLEVRLGVRSGLRLGACMWLCTARPAAEEVGVELVSLRVVGGQARRRVDGGLVFGFVFF